MDENIKYYVLEYTYIDDMVNKRKPYNKVHLEYVLSFIEKGMIVTCGPYVEGDGAVLIFKCNQLGEHKTPENFAKNDPFYINGLIPNYRFRQFYLGTPELLKNEIQKLKM